MDVHGIVVELDPTKDYIIVFDPRWVTHGQVDQFVRRPMRNGNVYQLSLKGFKIVENSDRIVGFTKIK